MEPIIKVKTSPVDMYYIKIVDNHIEWQGQVIERITIDKYLVTVTDFVKPNSSSRELLDINELDSCLFFQTKDDWLNTITNLWFDEDIRYLIQQIKAR